MQFFFDSGFHIFATNVGLSPEPPLFFASPKVLFSDRAGTFWHLDFDEQTVITHGTNLEMIGHTIARVSAEIWASKVDHSI